MNVQIHFFYLQKSLLLSRSMYYILGSLWPCLKWSRQIQQCNFKNKTNKTKHHCTGIQCILLKVLKYMVFHMVDVWLLDIQVMVTASTLTLKHCHRNWECWQENELASTLDPFVSLTPIALTSSRGISLFPPLHIPDIFLKCSSMSETATIFLQFAQG